MSAPERDAGVSAPAHPLGRRRLLGLFALQIPVSVALLLVVQAVGAKDAGAILTGLGDADLWVALAGFHLVAFGLQALLLEPTLRPVARRTRGTSILVSVGVAGVLAAVLAGALLFAVVDAFALYEDPRSATAFFAVVTSAWIAGTLLFRSFVRRRPRASPEELIGSIARFLLVGTAFEALAQIPLDVLIRRRTECYCFSASIVGWSLCIGVGLVVFGPAVLLPVLVRRRAAWYAERCDTCGDRLAVVATDARTAAPRCARCGVGG